MTNTVSPLQLNLIASNASETLIEQIVRLLIARIDDKLLRGGARMPSIRQFAAMHAVSNTTVVQAYDRLVGRGYLESRRGAGFFVREPATELTPSLIPHHDPQKAQMDVVWLVRSMFRKIPAQFMPGMGLLPASWLDAGLIANALRAVGRQSQESLLQYGEPQGYFPLRQQLQLKLAELEISAQPEQIVTTSGVTQALDLVAREFTRPGDTIFVDDPAWFLMYGSFAAMGVNVVGIPRLVDGPDMLQLAQLAQVHQPKLFVINSVLHNPTSTSLTAAKAFQLLQIAQQHDFYIVEDDIYCDMHPGTQYQAATRLASLDQLQRVIYLGGFSKTLAANLRVGFIACSLALAERFSDRKILSALTTPETGERVVYKILSEGLYRKHVERLRTRLMSERSKRIRQLENLGISIDFDPRAGMFLWLETGVDTNVLAEKAMAHDYLLAPGALFSPKQLSSTKMRLNLANLTDAGVLKFLADNLAKA